MLATWLFRGLESGNFAFSNLSPTDLMFASSMVCVLSMARLKNINNNKDLQEGLSNLFSFGLILCFSVFIAALLYQVQADTLLTEFYMAVKNSIQSNTDVVKAVANIDPTMHNDKMDLFRWTAICLSILVIGTALLCNFKYNLDGV